MQKNRILGIFLFIIVCIIFLLLRSKPLYYQTVAYTYDQGRDFLKASEIILNRKPTFLGPTTGIMGVFHGAWWYYVLVIPFIVFGGLPIGFYYFNLLIHFATFVALFFFIRKFFGPALAFITSFLIAISPYFISTSLFVGNNIMAIPCFLFFLICNFYLLEKKIEKKYATALFLTGLSLGLVMEFEFPFGLFLIPSYFILIFIFDQLKKTVLKLKNGLFFLLGLLIPFVPRILFEVRHDFLQTRTLLSFFFKPQLHNPKAYVNVFKDRVNLFIGYYKSIFTSDIVMLLFTLSILIAVFLIVRYKAKIYKSFLYFLLLLVGMLFLFSTLYKDNFWSNYYEGMPYGFVMIILSILSFEIKKQKKLSSYIPNALLGVLMIASIFPFNGILNKPRQEGLMVQTQVVSYLQNQLKGNNSYCVKIYTPPAIPYTYDYLFVYNSLSKKIAIPEKDWTNDQCWTIIEQDPYKFRREKWMEDNIPQSATPLLKHKVKDVDIILWRCVSSNRP
ncbi:hypothetical protein COT62_03175 [Candidatus Roizmanbacteria bacterium CG09_land_8_20_14_0_10_41_9]|uniref:Glycosyltransferase RgtA/B/C/D-like domain-containing protein n=1 Tax=Candidatus Roizmanbacteria bacterium CG09_land_8_20_14_0_10_41_9 TaxID=1974850 RepID=A0A2H0WSE6_9BACT|nr:MAG: hypothetical protein COT62_03175 [Candidatus Roizmanbacteria bacterium CG09_land_8_20_14_0_10_41_9]